MPNRCRLLVAGVFSTLRVSAFSSSLISSAPPPTFALFGLSSKQKTNDSPLFTIPSIFNKEDSRPIVLFDGKCNLCNAGVQLVLDTDRASTDPRGNLRVAALQSRVGQVLLSRLPLHQRKTVLSASDGDSQEFKSIVVAGEHQTWLNSAACLRIGRELKGPLRYLAAIASLFPAFIRDPVYKLMSRYRKKFFGETPECRLWDDNWDTRFVDDGLFGGRSEGDIDPFADPSAAKVVEDDEEMDEETCEGPLLRIGNKVRVVSSKAIVHTHTSGHDSLCPVGLVGEVLRVLDRRAYPKSVAVKFDLEDSASFVSHFYPGQLRIV